MYEKNVNPKKWAGELEVKRLAEAGVNPFVVRDAFSQGLKLNFSQKCLRFFKSFTFLFHQYNQIFNLSSSFGSTQLDRSSKSDFDP